MNRFWIHTAQGLVLFFCLGWSMPLRGLAMNETTSSDEESEILQEEQVVFQFSSSMDQAKAFLTQMTDHTREPSQWMGQYFDFGNLGEQHRIGLRRGTFQGKEKLGIFFKPFNESQKTIQFSKVPPGGALVFNYGIQDGDINQKIPTYFYVRIWAGNHLLQRIRVAQEPGWKEARIPLGVASFLNHPLLFSFDVISDSEQSPSFFFDARVIK